MCKALRRNLLVIVAMAVLATISTPLAFAGPAPPASDCCVANGELGCDDSECEATVCGADTFCCNISWDQICADQAAELCGALCDEVVDPCANKDCDDGSDCTTDSCNSETGECVNTVEAANCDDSNACTDDSCGASNCCAANGTPGCDDPSCEAILCADDSFCCGVEWDGICADQAAERCAGLCAVGHCVNEDISDKCNDDIDCTDDSCEPDSGCVYKEVDANCNDGVECTVDSCEAESGCEIKPNHSLCDDGVACTEDSCTPTGCDYEPVHAKCDDGVDCTTEVCDAEAGCTDPEPDHAFCEDGLFCTTNSCDVDAGCVLIDTCPAAIDGCIVHGACSEDEGRCIPQLDDSLCDDNNDCSEDICIGAGDPDLTANGGGGGHGGCIHKQLPLCGDTCRSAGYYGSHAGDAEGDNDVTGTIADACGCALICGEVLSNTKLKDANSYVEALCVAPRGDKGLTLARQLAALSLNCCASGYGNDCALDPFLGPLFAECNNTCVNGDPAAMQACYEKVECYNTGGITTETPPDNDCCAEGGNGTPGCSDPTCEGIVCGLDTFCCNTNWDGICAGIAAEECTELCAPELSCEPRLENNCHDQPLCNEDVGEGFCFEPSPRASSSKKCSAALKRVGGTRREPLHCTVLPPGEDNCETGTAGEQECCSDLTCVDDQDNLCSPDICEAGICTPTEEECTGDCCAANGTPGCEDPACTDKVCGSDPFCCNVEWDGLCADTAAQLCGDLCGPPVDPCGELAECSGECATPDGLVGVCVEGPPPLVANGDSPSGCVCKPPIVKECVQDQDVCGGECDTLDGQEGVCVAGDPTLVANGEAPSKCVCLPKIIIGDCLQDQDECGGECNSPEGPGECVPGGIGLTVGVDIPANCVCKPFFPCFGQGAGCFAP